MEFNNKPTQTQEIRAHLATLPPTDSAVLLESLNFSFGGPQILTNVNLSLVKGSRTLLIGANGIYSCPSTLYIPDYRIYSHPK
jgi:ATPase subunit of ABC transporter with duplicated ATPase domains